MDGELILDAAGPARPMPPAEYQGRLRGLLRRMAAAGIDGCLCYGEINRLYYTGFLSTYGLLAVDRRRGPVFLTDFRYLQMARAAIPFMPCQLLRRGPEGEAQMRTLMAGWERAGYEGSMAATRLHGLQAEHPGVREWTNIEVITAAQRAVKTRREQTAIRSAVRANDAVFAAVMADVRPGLREWDIRNLVRRQMDRLGQGEAFDCIPCVGANASECHHRPGTDLLRNNQALLLDLGLRRDHYCSDLTRSVFVGRPTPFFREIHGIVHAANRAVVSRLRPGMTGADVDAIGRERIEKAGYGKAFGHGLGHSLGLEIHESPSFAPGCRDRIEPGMVLTVEPGIYIPGRIGVRIEDVILVTADGCEVLSETPHWIVK